MLEILHGEREPEIACASLVTAAHKNGASDNVTVIIADVEEVSDALVRSVTQA